MKKFHDNSMKTEGIHNASFDDSFEDVSRISENSQDLTKTENDIEDENKRQTWGNPIEFLMSCISLSVGLGNIWRFPFTAYENGGGAFLIAYLVVLLMIGKPLYFLEMILGQFSSYGSVKVWSVVPFAKGIGYGSALSTWFVVTYYCCLMALTVFYFFSSFQTILPWSTCDPSWADEHCYNSSGIADNSTEAFNISGRISSVEQYFTKNVLQQSNIVEEGLGAPEWRLSLCLLFSWIIIAFILMKGVASSGKAAYFTAIFPYVVLFTLLIRGVTLPGAVDGIILFFKPDLWKLLEPGVWYAAVTQCFFSLSVGFGPVIMNSSYNQFRHKIYRDSMIVSLMDTFTSLLAGVTIFSILGNLAYESGKPIESVVSGGTGLAFVSYPEAIGKFNVVPQLFAVLFFLMLFTLGIGSAVSLTGCVITIVCDAFPTWKRWVVTLVICSSGFLLGLVYVTPGGQDVLEIVDFFGGGFIIFVMAILEVVAISWIYGLNNFLRDVEFMLGFKLGIYWKFTWGFFIPFSLMGIFVYSLSNFRTFDSGKYPESLIAVGWTLAALALIQVPLWGIYAVLKQKTGSFIQRFFNSFKATDAWGPKDPKTRSQWILVKGEHMNPSRISMWMRNVLKMDAHNINSKSSKLENNDFQSTHSVVQLSGWQYSSSAQS